MLVHYTVPGLTFVYAQPNTRACWATVYAMMKAWRQRCGFRNIRSAIAALGQPWLGYYDSNTGIPSAQGTEFERAVSLTREPRLNPSPEWWESMLQAHGLLWVNGTVRGHIHDRILRGISGDGTGSGTQMFIIDPAGGRQYQETLSTFIQGSEDQAALKPTRDNYQILHF